MTTDTQSATSEATSLRDDISQAFDAVEAEASAPEIKDEEQEKSVDEEATDEPKAEDEKPAEEEKTEDEEKKDDEKAVVKAPQSWTPGMREKFAELPEEVRAEILRVENAQGAKFREHAQVRQVADNFVNVVKPYEDVIKESGATPFQAIGEMLEMGKSLMKGSPRQKAEVIAQLFETYKVDIAELDDVLTARISAPQPSATERALLQKLTALEQRITPAPRPAEAATNQASSLNSEVQAFAQDPKNEFFNEVVGDMQLLLQTGRAENLKDAYTKAIRLNDEVQKVIEDRKAKAAQRVTAGTSSLKGGSPKATPKKSDDNLSLREQLSKHYDEHMGS